MENNKKILNTIGMAVKANKIIFGFRLLESIKSQKIKFVIFSSNMGESQKKKFTDKCKFYNIDFIELNLTSEELSKSCGKKKIVAIGITDSNFSKMIKGVIND